MKKLISIILTLLLVLSLFVPFATVYAAQEEGSATGSADGAKMDGELKVKAENSFGKLFADAVGSEQERRQSDSGSVVMSVEMSGNTAAATFFVTKDATLLVAVYSEDGTQMLTCESVKVEKDQNTAQVTFSDSLPQYYLVKAYLIDSESLAPLSSEYSNPNYTRHMQEFLAKTTDDFEGDRVIDFDGDKADNFAVIRSDAAFLKSTGRANIYLPDEGEDGEYVFKNPDEALSGMQTGAVFVIECGPDELLAVKIKEKKTVEGNKIAFVCDEMELKDVFEYVKVDQESDSGNTTFKPYHGQVDDGKGGDPVGAIEYEYSHPHVLNFNFMDFKQEVGDSSVSLSGTASLGLTTSFKVYLSLQDFYVELKVDFTANVNITLKAELAVKVPLGYYGFHPVPGTYVEFMPSIVISCTGKLELEASISGSVGMKADKNGIHNISKPLAVKAELKAEVTVFIGVSLEPKIGILDDLLKASMDASIGAEIKAESSKTIYEKYPEEKHECEECLEGEVKEKASIDFSVSFLKKKGKADKDDKDKKDNKDDKKEDKKHDLKITLFDVPLFEFYYSLDYKEFGFGKCPHKSYRTTFVFDNLEKTPKVNASLDGEAVTDSPENKTIVYLKPGKYKIKATNPEGLSTSETIEVKKASDVELTCDFNDYRDKFIDALMSNSSEWAKSVVYSMSFTDLNFDGKLEFVIDYVSGSGMDRMGITYRFDGKNYYEVSGEDSLSQRGYQDNLTLYYDKKNKKKVWLGNAILRNGIWASWTGNFILEYRDGATYPMYYRSQTTELQSDMKTRDYVFYNGAVSYGYTGGYEVITEQEYEKLDNDVRANLTDLNASRKAVVYSKWKNKSTSAKKKDLKDSYDGFTYDNYDKTKFSVSEPIDLNIETIEKYEDKVGEAVGADASADSSFRDLLPNTVYNFYSMVSRDAENPLDKSNLRYITQFVTDENGEASLDMEPGDFENFVIPMEERSIDDADIQVNTFTDDHGMRQYRDMNVKIGNVVLKEKEDYFVRIDYFADEYFTVTVTGTGMYSGTKEMRFEQSKIKFGDVDGDGMITAKDRVYLTRYLAKWKEYRAPDLQASDLNGDGKVNTQDRIILARYLAKWEGYESLPCAK